MGTGRSLDGLGVGLPGIEHTQAVPHTLLTEPVHEDSYPDTGKHNGSLARTVTEEEL